MLFTATEKLHFGFKICVKFLLHSPLSLLRLRTRIIVNAQTAAQQQSNGSYEARRSRKCGEWRN